ncbi:MAG: YccF domain-containing protein [Oscillochloridaceae bacterium umkhey_bin13]
MTTTTTYREERGVNLLLRAIYFLVFGLWFSAIWATIAWVLCVTIIGLPLGLWMLNRLPQVTTLRPQRNDLRVTASGEIYRSNVEQRPFIIRAIWFLLVGWWLSAIWMSVAWALCTVIIGLPFGFWMFDRVPTVVTLARS